MGIIKGQAEAPILGNACTSLKLISIWCTSSFAYSVFPKITRLIMSIEDWTRSQNTVGRYGENGSTLHEFDIF